MPKVCLLAVVAALFAVGCGVDPPTTAPSPQPAHGTPSRIELSATAGVGEHGGTATVTARVLDAYALLLPDVAVAFTANAGTLSAATVATNSNGIATTTLTADPGTVKLTAAAGAVTAPQLEVTIQPVNIFVPPPVVPPPPPPPVPDVPLTASISASPAPVGSATALGVSTNGTVASAAWTFGDGQSATTTAPSTTHTYATSGEVTVSVTITDPKGRKASDARIITISPAPVASFSVTLTPAPTSVAVGSPVTLTAAAMPQNTTLAATSFRWDCGEGVPTTDALKTHQCVYTTTGTKAASVIASNGAVTGTGSATVTVNAAPLAVSIDPVTATSGVSATITARVTSIGALPTNALAWEWDFESSATSTFTKTESAALVGDAHSTTNIYSTTGAMTIRVRVTDLLTGRTATGTRQITVLP